MEKLLIVIVLLLLAFSVLQVIENYKLKKELKWFENWGREYLEKHRDKARKDGLTK
jgi:hypothetical protein